MVDILIDIVFFIMAMFLVIMGICLVKEIYEDCKYNKHHGH